MNLGAWGENFADFEVLLHFFLPYFLFLFQTVPVHLFHHRSTVTSIKGDVFSS